MPPLKSVALPDGRQSGTALLVARGTRRLLWRLNFSTVTELPLLSGRRADIVALASDATILIVEIKSSVADFRADAKWRDYRAHCDRLFFAIPETVPAEIMPEDAGLILADAYGAGILWQAPEHRMAIRHAPRGAHAFCAGRGAPAALLERPRGASEGRLDEEPLNVMMNGAVKPRKANLFRTLRRRRSPART